MLHSVLVSVAWGSGRFVLHVLFLFLVLVLVSRVVPAAVVLDNSTLRALVELQLHYGEGTAQEHAA
jgi:hypothetical protein